MGKNTVDLQTEEFIVIKPGSTFGNNCLIRSHTVIYTGNRIGNNFQTGHGVLIRENNRIGNNVSIGSHSVIEHDVIIENDCRVHSNTFIPEFSVLKRNSWIGPCVVLTNAKYPKSKNAKLNLRGVVVGENAKIGAGAVILPGVKIGRNVLVGAGSVVTRDIEDNVVVAGNPAKVIKSISEIKDYEK